MKGEESPHRVEEEVINKAYLEGIYQQDLTDDEVITRFSSLVHKIAHTLYRHIGQSLLFEDVLAYGMTGLLSAHRRYNDDYDVVFTTYAYYRIRGEILDGCRRAGADLRRHKALRELLAINDYFEQKLLSPNQQGRAFPDCVQNLRHMVGDATILYYLRRSALHPTTSTTPPQRKLLESRDLYVRLRAAVSEIGGREQEILELYYFEDMNMEEIAERMSLSKSWVSRIHGRAIVKVREVLMENKEFCDNYNIIRI